MAAPRFDRAKPVRTLAVLLRSVDYGEADRIVTLLTERHGRVPLLAKHARKSTKRFAGALEPFGVIEAELAISLADVGRLSSARLVRGFPEILASLPSMRIAGAALDLVRVATPPRESDPELLATVIELFEALARTPSESARVAFAIRYLALLGLAPRVDLCAKCGKRPQEGQSSLFDPASGSIVCRACGGGPMLLPGTTRARMMDAGEADWMRNLERWTEDDVRLASEVLEAFVERHVAGAKMR